MPVQHDPADARLGRDVVEARRGATFYFYGASMLLAAWRGYAECEVLAVFDWLLRRDDQVGCAVFAPVDDLEPRWPRRGRPA